MTQILDRSRHAATHTIDPTCPRNAITVREAAIQRGKQTIWSDVSFSVRLGEFTAILGPNGAGKSTLIKMLLGLLPLAHGRAEVLGSPPGRRSTGIGYLPQRRTFDASTRVRASDIVRLGLDGARWGFPLPFADRLRGWPVRRRVDRALELAGAHPYANRPIGRLSGGEQQRVLIAQALVGDPQVLMLDEPLDSLDISNQTAIAALLHRICRTQTMSVLLVAHDVNPILPYLDKVIYVANGTAVYGPPDTIITSRTLSRLYGTPIEVLRTSTGRLVVVGTPEAPFLHESRHAPITPGSSHGH